MSKEKQMDSEQLQVMDNLAKSLIKEPVAELNNLLKELNDQTSYSDILESTKKIGYTLVRFSKVNSALNDVEKLLKTPDDKL